MNDCKFAGYSVVSSLTGSIGPGVVQLLPSNNRRLSLSFSTESLTAGSINYYIGRPDLGVFPNNEVLPVPFALIDAHTTRIGATFKYADIGAFMHGELWANINPGPATVSLVEMLVSEPWSDKFGDYCTTTFSRNYLFNQTVSSPTIQLFPGNPRRVALGFNRQTSSTYIIGFGNSGVLSRGFVSFGTRLQTYAYNDLGPMIRESVHLSVFNSPGSTYQFVETIGVD